MTENIHHGGSVKQLGADLQDATLLVILLHGRGASVDSMVPLAQALDMPGIRFLIPQAALSRWYPQSAFGPIEANEPDLSSALEWVDALVEGANRNGISHQQIILGGFSQGACLACEYVARNARNYGGLFVLSGALIGLPGTSRDYPGSLEGMPVFIGGSDVDPWIPLGVQSETAMVFENMGAEVDFRTYPGMDHTVNQDEIDCVRVMLENAMQVISEQVVRSA